jgi:hypothetical protein
MTFFAGLVLVVVLIVALIKSLLPVGMATVKVTRE